MRDIEYEATTPVGVHIVPDGDFSLVLHDGGQRVQMWCNDGVVDEWPVTRLRESTGLDDKNGKRIFEGDILGFDWVYQDGREFAMNLTGPVQWLGGKFVVRHGYSQFDAADINQATFERTWREQYRSGVQDEYFQLKGFKVIGNIYDNPELTEG
jgi:uncharacterized phage protein (TIGR01671 family)